MSANFSLTVNSQFDNDSSKRSRNVGAVVSELNLIILGRIFPEGVAFFWFIVLISFSISDTPIASNLKDLSFPILFLMSIGWISYFIWKKKRFYCFPKNFILNKRWIKVIEEFFSIFFIKSALVAFLSFVSFTWIFCSGF